MVQLLSVVWTVLCETVTVNNFICVKMCSSDFTCGLWWAVCDRAEDQIFKRVFKELSLPLEHSLTVGKLW
jgi:hypothetical protein